MSSALANTVDRALKSTGKDYSLAAGEARKARAQWLDLTGGIEAKAVSVDLGSETSRIGAV